MERPSGVSSASDASCAASASSVSLTPSRAAGTRRLPVAEGDRAGLVEQQRVDVAGRFDRAPGHRQHVVLDQAVHAGDADRRQQAADGRRDQADEQRHEDEHRLRRVRVDANGCSVTTAIRKTIVKPASRMLSAISFGVFCRSAPSTSAIIRSRNVWPGIGRDPDLDPVREHARATGHRRAIAAGFANDGCGLARDRRLVHRGDALDDLAVGRDELAGAHDDDVVLAQRRGRNGLRRGRSTIRFATVSVRVFRSVSACALPRPSAIASAKLANRTVSPEPERDLQLEADAAAARRRRSRTSRTVVRTRADLDDEHDRVLRHHSRIELAERVDDRAAHQRRIPDAEFLCRCHLDCPASVDLKRRARVHQEVLDDRAEAEHREERQDADDDDDADEQRREQRRRHREGAERRRHARSCRRDCRPAPASG